MATKKVAVVLTVEYEDDDVYSIESNVGIQLSNQEYNILFIGTPRPVDAEPRLGEMLGIKEHMKLAYAKLKRLHVNTFVHIYQDLIQALLKI